MNTLSPMLTQLLSDAGQGGVASQAGPAGDAPFTLEQAGPLLQRLAQHKTQPNADTPRHQADDDKAMQAMLALMLSQVTLPAEAKTPAGQENAMIATLVQKRQSLPQAMAQTAGVTGKQNAPAAPLNAPSLPPQLEKLFAQLTASGDITLTPQQQATLAALRAQDPKQIGTEAQPLHDAHPRVTAEAPSAAHRPVVKEKTAQHPGLTATSSAALHPAQALNNSRASVIETAKTAPLMTQQEEWGEKLTGLLKDRIHFQINQQQQISTIRLDPPSLGKLDIAIQLDAGKLAVHINASQPDVGRSLQQLSEQLRQQLTGQHFSQVDVNVTTQSGGDRQQQQQQQRQQQDETILTARAISSEPDGEQQHDPLLIKV